MRAGSSLLTDAAARASTMHLRAAAGRETPTHAHAIFFTTQPLHVRELSISQEERRGTGSTLVRCEDVPAGSQSVRAFLYPLARFASSGWWCGVPRQDEMEGWEQARPCCEWPIMAARSRSLLAAMRAREVELEEDVATLQAQLASTNAPPHQRVKHGSSSRAAAPPAEINLDPARAVAQLSAGLRAFSPILCAPAALLVPEQEDDWTCGHLNLATLLRCFRGRDWSVDVPGIVTLLHLAWAEGFDPHRPYGDREDGWIGALDMLSVLLHLRFDACLLQVVGDVASQGDDAPHQSLMVGLQRQLMFYLANELFE